MNPLASTKDESESSETKKSSKKIGTIEFKVTIGRSARRNVERMNWTVTLAGFARISSVGLACQMRFLQAVTICMQL